MPIPDLCPCPCVSARRRVWPDGGGALGDSELPSEWESRRPLPLSAPGPDKGAKKGRPASVADAFAFQIMCLSRCFLMMVTDGKASPPILPGNDSLIHPAIQSTFSEHPLFTGTGLGPAETNLRKTPRVLSKTKRGKETGFVCWTSFDQMKMEVSLMVTAPRGRQAVEKAAAHTNCPSVHFDPSSACHGASDRWV